MKYKRYLKNIFLSLLLIFGGSQAAKAYTGACSPTNGTYNFTYNFGNITVVDPKGNKPGYLFPRPYEWNLGGKYNASCDCDPVKEDESNTNSDTYYSTATILNTGHSDGTYQFFTVNDYLEVTTSIWMAGTRLAFIPTPWNDENNLFSKGGFARAYKCKDPTNPNRTSGSTWTTGSQGKLLLYIAKPFVGTIFVENVKVVDIYASLTPGSYGSIPMSSVWINGLISVPQNCIIDSGQIITVDFGKIWSGDFTTKGQKPVGYIEKKIKASMKCNNIAAYTNLTLRFQSEVSPDDSTFIKTDNADVGVELLDENGKLVLPNNGLMPFTINENYEASVSFQVAPVSTTGNVPTAGQFKALAYIRVDFA